MVTNSRDHSRFPRSVLWFVERQNPNPLAMTLSESLEGIGMFRLG